MRRGGDSSTAATPRTTRRAVFLDRDGVLNRALLRNGRPHPPSSLEELEIVPEAASAMAGLRSAGFVLVVVTNQPDVARGAVPRAQVEAINGRLRAALDLDDIRVCYHDDADACDCRKPKPGMLVSAAGELALDLGRSFMVGDLWRDVEPGRAAGCTTVLLEYPYSEPERCRPHHRVSSLPEAAAWILARSDGDGEPT